MQQVVHCVRPPHAEQLAPRRRRAEGKIRRQVEVGHEPQQITDRKGRIGPHNKMQEVIKAVVERCGQHPDHAETDKRGKEFLSLYHKDILRFCLLPAETVKDVIPLIVATTVIGGIHFFQRELLTVTFQKGCRHLASHKHVSFRRGRETIERHHPVAQIEVDRERMHAVPLHHIGTEGIQPAFGHDAAYFLRHGTV